MRARKTTVCGSRRLVFEGLEPRLALSAAPVVDLNGPDQPGCDYQILAGLVGTAHPFADIDVQVLDSDSPMIERMEIWTDPPADTYLGVETAGTAITAHSANGYPSTVVLEGPAPLADFEAVLRSSRVELLSWPRLLSTVVNVKAYDGELESNVAQATFTTELRPELATTIGLYDPESSVFMLRNSNTTGIADFSFGFGLPGERWQPISGDWDGDGVDTVGLYDPHHSVFYLSNENGRPYADVVCAFGVPEAGWLPVAGDWDGNGTDTIGLYDYIYGRWFLRNSNTTGIAEVEFDPIPARYARIPVPGDQYGARREGLGDYDPLTAKWSTTEGSYYFGPAGVYTRHWPVFGDWIGQGYQTPGLYDQVNGLFHLRNSHTTGLADEVVAFGVPGNEWIPLVGDWDGPLNAGLGF